MNSKTVYKMLALAVVLVLSLGILAACGGQAEQPAAGTEEPAGEPAAEPADNGDATPAGEAQSDVDKWLTRVEGDIDFDILLPGYLPEGFSIRAMEAVENEEGGKDLRITLGKLTITESTIAPEAPVDANGEAIPTEEITVGDTTGIWYEYGEGTFDRSLTFQKGDIYITLFLPQAKPESLGQDEFVKIAESMQ